MWVLIWVWAWQKEHGQEHLKPYREYLNDCKQFIGKNGIKGAATEGSGDEKYIIRKLGEIIVTEWQRFSQITSYTEVESRLGKWDT